MLAANLAGTALLRSVVEKPSPVAGAVVQLASIGAAVEVFAWSERTATRRWPARCGGRATSCSARSARASRRAEQLEVGRAALAEILRVEGSA